MNDPAYEALRAAERAKRELREVGFELSRIEREGLPYNGPEIEWQSGNLAATTPEPHIALGSEYLEMNEDIVVDSDYLLKLRMQLAQESGYRERVLDEAINELGV